MKKGHNGTKGLTNGHDPDVIRAFLFLRSPNNLYLHSLFPEEQEAILSVFNRIARSVQEQCKLLGIEADMSKSSAGEILVSGKPLEIDKLKSYMRKRSWLLYLLMQETASDTFVPSNSRPTNAK